MTKAITKTLGKTCLFMVDRAIDWREVISNTKGMVFYIDNQTLSGTFAGPSGPKLMLKGGNREMRKVLAVLVALSMLLIAGQVMAEKVMTPESIEGVTVVDADWVKANLGKVKIYDARKKGEYVEKHIPGAISAPYKEKSAKSVDFDPSKDKFKLSKYPKDKSTPIVVYCNGPKCWKSYKTAVMLVRNGYTNVHWLRDGFPGWLEKGYPTE